jgi:NhaC family Na+:H+ antiporter
MLMRLIESTLVMAKSTGSLVLAVVLSCIGVNIVAADQYIAIVLPGKMYKAEFQKRGLAAQNLSRAIEDSGTLTSPLVPWNTCGAYMAATLGVATFAYLPFAFFNLINPLVSVIYGYTGFTIRKVDEVPAEAVLA